jgi:hypothetical protein
LQIEKQDLFSFIVVVVAWEDKNCFTTHQQLSSNDAITLTMLKWNAFHLYIFSALQEIESFQTMINKLRAG